MKAIRNLIMFVLLALGAGSCLKGPGEGGTSTIIGKVFAYDYNMEMDNLRASYYAPNERVFLVYGDDSIFSDDTRTSYDGSYRFDYLRPGTYKVFAYSKNLQTRLPPDYAVIKTVQIISDHQVILVEDIEIVK